MSPYAARVQMSALELLGLQVPKNHRYAQRDFSTTAMSSEKFCAILDRATLVYHYNVLSAKN